MTEARKLLQELQRTHFLVASQPAMAIMFLIWCLTVLNPFNEGTDPFNPPAQVHTVFEASAYSQQPLQPLQPQNPEEVHMSLICGYDGPLLSYRHYLT